MHVHNACILHEQPPTISVWLSEVCPAIFTWIWVVMVTSMFYGSRSILGLFVLEVGVGNLLKLQVIVYGGKW